MIDDSSSLRIAEKDGVAGRRERRRGVQRLTGGRPILWSVGWGFGVGAFQPIFTVRARLVRKVNSVRMVTDLSEVNW